MKIMKIIETARAREAANDLSEDFILEHGLADVGVSDWTPRTGPVCEAESQDDPDGWQACSRRESHTGPHVCADGQVVVASWCEPPKPERPDKAIEWAHHCPSLSDPGRLVTWIDYLESEAVK